MAARKILERVQVDRVDTGKEEQRWVNPIVVTPRCANCRGQPAYVDKRSNGSRWTAKCEHFYSGGASSSVVLVLSVQLRSNTGEHRGSDRMQDHGDRLVQLHSRTVHPSVERSTSDVSKLCDRL